MLLFSPILTMPVLLGIQTYKINFQINYLGCLFDEKCTGESMALRVLEKINGRLKFLWRKNKFLTPPLKRLLCNALIQPHFDYASSAWYPNLQKKLSKKLQTCQNKCIRFCLSLGNRSHVGIEQFKDINWLPVKERFDQNVLTHIFKQQNNLAPKYMDEIFTSANLCNIKTRSSSYKLILPHCNKASGHNTISSLGPRLWNKLPSDIKLSNNPNSFKHKVKMHFLELLEKETDDSFFYY